MRLPLSHALNEHPEGAARARMGFFMRLRNSSQGNRVARELVLEAAARGLEFHLLSDHGRGFAKVFVASGWRP